MVRPYFKEDYEVIGAWLKIPEYTLPLDSTFVAEYDGKPAVMLTVYFTNDPTFALLENFIGDPDLDKSIRRPLSAELAEHVERVAKSRGVTRLVCLAPHEKLTKRYQELGYSVVLQNINALVRDI